MVQRPEHIFFDLDHTLWDYETNSKATIAQLLIDYQAHFGRQIHFDELFPIYSKHNFEHWDRYRKNEIDSATLRISRWEATFLDFGIERDDWIDRLSVDFITHCPQKTQLMPDAKRVLEILSKEFPMHLITNGYLDVQKVKIACSGLDQYFQEMTTPETAGVKKPNPKIFLDALEKAKCKPENALYIGDSYAEDVEGGHQVGMKVIYYNPESAENPRNFPEIQHLSELLSLLGMA